MASTAIARQAAPRKAEVAVRGQATAVLALLTNRAEGGVEVLGDGEPLADRRRQAAI